MHEPLKNRTYLGKKVVFNFLGVNFVDPKSGHQHEKQHVLGPGRPNSFLFAYYFYSFGNSIKGVTNFQIRIAEI